MEYEIHGKPINVDYNCGMYHAEKGFLSMSFGLINFDLVVKRINSFPKDKVLEELTNFRKKAELQSKLTNTPVDVDYVIFGRSGIPKIDEVRKTIENTVRFCDDVLRILKSD